MAADILLYQTTHVPVGEDQRQHLELAVKIAKAFNEQYKTEHFAIPEGMSGPSEGVRRVMSLRDGSKKMSKSDPSAKSRISLLDSADDIASKISKARTHAEPWFRYEDDSAPETKNLYNILSALSGRPIPVLADEFKDASKQEFKAALTDVLVAKICPIGDEVRRLMADPGHVDDVLRIGADQARSVAAENVSAVKRIVGLGSS
jgi:tryptophanyl-tRNA synthetase